MQNPQTALYYNGIAKGYKNLYHQEQLKKINLIKNKLIQMGTILDMGSGDGVLNNILSNDVKLISCDISKNLLKINNNENRILCDIHELPFKNNIFDQIIAITSIQDTTYPEKVITEANRTLKKNGIFIISFLKISKKTSKIQESINTNFQIEKVIEEEKDLIIIANKK